MPIHLQFEPSGLIVSRLTGDITLAQLNDAKRAVFAHLMTQGSAPMLLCIEPGFPGLNALVQWDDIPEDAFIQQHITRMAFVGDLRWRDTAMLFFFHGMVPFPMDYFPQNQYELALAWLTAP